MHKVSTFEKNNFIIRKWGKEVLIERNTFTHKRVHTHTQINIENFERECNYDISRTRLFNNNVVRSIKFLKLPSWRFWYFQIFSCHVDHHSVLLLNFAVNVFNDTVKMFRMNSSNVKDYFRENHFWWQYVVKRTFTSPVSSQDKSNQIERILVITDKQSNCWYHKAVQIKLVWQPNRVILLLHT